MGRYNVVVEDDEDIVWEKDEGGNVTHILLVGFIVFMLRFKLKFNQENNCDHVVASAILPSFHQRPTPVGSCSGSVPCSYSVASGSHVSSIGSNAALASNFSELIGGPSKLSKENKDLLLEYLGIDTSLPSLGPPGLYSAYQKFKAIMNATPKVMGLSKDAEWKAQFGDTHPWIPTIVHFIDIFVAKTQFYQFWKPLFSKAQEYPEMKDWLNQHKDRLSTQELWNEQGIAWVTRGFFVSLD